MISLIVNVDDPNQSGLLETFASVRKTEQTNFVISGEELTFFHRPVKVSTTATQPWEDDWLASDAFEFAIGLPGEDFVAYSDTYTAANPGVNGTITVNTVAVVAAFADTTDDALPFVFSIKRTRVSGEVAEYYQAHCTLKRSVINPGSAIPTPSASYYTKTESDSRFAPLSSVVTTGTGLWYLSSGAPSVLTVGSGLTIVGSTISATGGGGSGTAYLYADQEFTGTNNFGVATFDPSDSTFGDSPTLRLASGSYVMVAGDETGEAGVISNSGGSLVLESALGTNYNVGEGIMYGLPGGTLNLTTQSLTGEWETAKWTVNNTGLALATTPQLVVSNDATTVKTRLGVTKSATDAGWTGAMWTVNSSIGLDGVGGGAKDDASKPKDFLQIENNWDPGGGLPRQDEFHVTLADNRLFQLNARSATPNIGWGSIMCPIDIEVASNNTFYERDNATTTLVAYRSTNTFSRVAIINKNVATTAAGSTLELKGIGSAGSGISGGYSTWWALTTDLGTGGTTTAGTNSLTFNNRRAASEGASDAVQRPMTLNHDGTVTFRGTLSVTGASTLTGLLTANGGATVAGGIGVGVAVASTTFAAIAAGTTAKSAINLASGAAPTSPNNGDIWFDGTDLKMRVGGVTKTFTLI